VESQIFAGMQWVADNIADNVEKYSEEVAAAKKAAAAALAASK
jgi:hypothetical protein